MTYNLHRLRLALDYNRGTRYRLIRRLRQELFDNVMRLGLCVRRDVKTNSLYYCVTYEGAPLPNHRYRQSDEAMFAFFNLMDDAYQCGLVHILHLTRQV